MESRPERDARQAKTLKGGWYPRRRGILEHLDRGTISLLDSAVHDFLCLTADYRTGVAQASGEKIFALAGDEISSRTIRRSLEHLERIGWIKRWMTQGKRGNYPILIARFYVRKCVHDLVHDPVHEWFATNAERTTDWKDVQFDRVHDPDTDPVRDPGHDVSSIQEGRPNNKEESNIKTTSTRSTGQTAQNSRKPEITPQLVWEMSAEMPSVLCRKCIRRGSASCPECVSGLQRIEDYLTEWACRVPAAHGRENRATAWQ